MAASDYFYAPQILADWGGLNSDNVLYYFAQSQFFDQMSNNAVVFNQAQRNPAMGHLLATRGAFENHLRGMSGVEFMVAGDPSRGSSIPFDQINGCGVC